MNQRLSERGAKRLVPVLPGSGFLRVMPVCLAGGTAKVMWFWRELLRSHFG